MHKHGDQHNRNERHQYHLRRDDPHSSCRRRDATADATQGEIRGRGSVWCRHSVGIPAYFQAYRVGYRD